MVALALYRLHEYEVLCMWEQNPSTFLEDVSLLPLATLAITQFLDQLLKQIAQRVSTIKFFNKIAADQVSLFT